MKIVKLCVIDGLYYVVFDEIPEITYEQVGTSFVGSYIDSNGHIILSDYLSYSEYSNGFDGRGFTIKMKDGTEKRIEKFWFDRGHYPDHGRFTKIGASTVEVLKKLYIYRSLKINSHIFQGMLRDYYNRDRDYSYTEIEDWIDSEKEQKW